MQICYLYNLKNSRTPCSDFLVLVNFFSASRSKVISLLLRGKISDLEKVNLVAAVTVSWIQEWF